MSGSVQKVWCCLLGTGLILGQQCGPLGLPLTFDIVIIHNCQMRTLALFCLFVFCLCELPCSEIINLLTSTMYFVPNWISLNILYNCLPFLLLNLSSSSDHLPALLSPSVLCPVSAITVSSPAEVHSVRGDAVTLTCTFTSTSRATSRMSVDWSYRPQTGGPPQAVSTHHRKWISILSWLIIQRTLNEELLCFYALAWVHSIWLPPALPSQYIDLNCDAR